MAITDGDPRRLAPDLFARLTALERRQALKWFGLRVGMVGVGRPKHPDDEPPASVARNAIVHGMFSAAILLTGLPLWCFAVCLSIVLSGTSGWWFAGAVGFGTYSVAVLALLPWRLRQVNRYFAQLQADARRSGSGGT